MSLLLADPRSNPVILNRAEARRHVDRHLTPLVSALDDLVDYGTHLIPRCWLSSKRDLTDMILLPVLLKQVVGLIDSGAVLIREACIEPSLLPLRAAFEASVYVDWILKSDTPRRARAYYVWNVRRTLKWTRRAKRGTVEQTAFSREFRKLKIRSKLSSRAMQTELAKEAKRLEDHLRAPKNRGLNQAFQNRKGRRLYDCDWYNALFPRRKQASLYTLCGRLNRVHEYRLIYELGSEAKHSSRYSAHVRVLQDKKLHIRSLRDLTDVGLISQLLLGTGLHTYTAILAHYRFAELEQFQRDYVTRWRMAFLTPIDVKYDYVEQAIV